MCGLEPGFQLSSGESQAFSILPCTFWSRQESQQEEEARGRRDKSSRVPRKC